MPHGHDKDMVALAASICVGYSKNPDNTVVDVSVTGPRGKEIIRTIGIPPDKVKHFLM